MDAIQALLDAANYLESRSTAIVLPRDAIDSAVCPASFIPIPQLQQLASRVSSSPVNPGSPSDDHEAQAARRSGGAGTREVHNKLEKHRRAHLRECFGSLNNLLPSRENRRQSNHSILLGTISHIKELERTHDLFCKEREKEKFQQRSLQNKLKHILNTSDSLENLRQANVSSPSTDTASDISDEGNVQHAAIDSCKATALFSPDSSVPTQCPDVTSTAHPASTFLLCPVLDQKIPHVQGTVFIQAPISFTQPFKPADSAAAAATLVSAATSAALSGLLPASLATANPVSSVSKLLPSTQTSPQSSGQLKNLSQRPMVAWISSEVIPATSSQPGNPRMAVQMLQQTLAQRAIEQQKKQSQMLLGQNQPAAHASEKGSSTTKTTKMLQPTAIAPQSHHHHPAVLSSLLSLSSSPLYQMSSSSTAPSMNESPLFSEVRVSVATVPQLVVPTASLHGTSLAHGTTSIFSGLQLLSSNQFSSLQTRSMNDFAQLGVQHTSIPFIQFVNSLPVVGPPSNIPILTSDSSYRHQHQQQYQHQQQQHQQQHQQQVVASVVSTPVMMSSIERPSSRAMMIAAENLLLPVVSCPSTQSSS